MLDIKYILSNVDEVKVKNSLRGVDIDIDTLISLENSRKDKIKELEELQNQRNSASKKIGGLKKEGIDTQEMQNTVNSIAKNIDEIKAQLASVEDKIKEILLEIPNIVDDTTPKGKSEEENQLYKTNGAIPKFSFTPKQHWELGTQLGIMDFERGVKISKSRFTMLVGNGARLERALINFMMDLHSERGFKEVLPPYLVNPTSMTGTGQLPKFKEEAFLCDKDNLYLIPTAEVPVTNMYADEILKESDLPLRYCAYSACFRREAGSYGKDMRGFLRQHQFDKVELVKFTTPEQSEAELEHLLLEAEEVLIRLGLPYRVMTLCSGDIGFSSSKTYDIEVWLPGQNAYREISSCSNCKDFQARRANIKYKGTNGKNLFVHTLNGSALAVGRTLIAIMENYQQPDGTIIVPEALRPYMGMNLIK